MSYVTVTKSATRASSFLLPERQLTPFLYRAIVSAMVKGNASPEFSRRKQPRRNAVGPLYLTEWMVHLNVSDEQLAKRMGVRRETVWRWQNEQGRLDALKIAKIAITLSIDPADLWRHPNRVSLDSAGRHIKDSASLERLARYIRELPPSDG